MYKFMRKVFREGPSHCKIWTEILSEKNSSLEKCLPSSLLKFHNRFLSLTQHFFLFLFSPQVANDQVGNRQWSCTNVFISYFSAKGHYQTKHSVVSTTIQPLRTVDFYTIIKTIHWFNYSFSKIIFTHYAIIQYLVLWLAFVNLTKKLRSSGKKKPQLRTYLQQIVLLEYLWGIFYIYDSCVRAQATVGGANSRWVYWVV